MIAVVVPTIRPDSYAHFLEAWQPFFHKYQIEIVKVEDGENPHVIHNEKNMSINDVMGEYEDIIYNFNDGVRNLGFAYIARFLKEADTIISFDDDVEPYGDTIADHMHALSLFVPVSWMSTASEFTRGFPYSLRQEAEVVMSHGVWHGVADWDAPTQLTQGNKPLSFYKGPIPKGIYYPHCAMNFAFKRKMLPFVYQAPMGEKAGVDRFADIWMGIESKKEIDKNKWAVVTGYSAVKHERASNVYVNLVKEAKGIKMNEEYGKDDYFSLYNDRLLKWKKCIYEWEKS